MIQVDGYFSPKIYRPNSAWARFGRDRFALSPPIETISVGRETAAEIGGEP